MPLTATPLTDVIAAHPLFIVSCTIAFGLIAGSFLNVVIYRLPIMMKHKWKAAAKQILAIDDHHERMPTPTLFTPRSHCPHCSIPVKTWHMIPVFSYLLLKGQCHHCRMPISPRYPIVEAVTALLAGIIAWQLSSPLAILAALVLTGCLISLSVIDSYHQLLPDEITLPLLWLGLIVNSGGLFVPLTDALWGAVAGYLSLWCVYWVFKWVTGKEGLGFGDLKLLAALGAWMGWQALPLIIIMASLAGAIVGALFLAITKQKRHTPLPFGPYLASAGWITLLWGKSMTSHYLAWVGLYV